MGVLLPNVTSVAAVGIIFGLIFARDYGIVNWALGHVGLDQPIDWQGHRWSSWLAISVMVDWRWTGYNALILLASLQSVPKELYEAARIDGASAWRQFWSITVPMLRPTIIFVSIVATIGGIQLFTEPLLFGSGVNAIAGGTTRSVPDRGDVPRAAGLHGSTLRVRLHRRVGPVPHHRGLRGDQRGAPAPDQVGGLR